MQTIAETTNLELPNEPSDPLLLDLYLAHRSPEYFLELVKRHSGMVFKTCLRVTRNVQDAEELTQECFYDLIRHAGKIQSSLAGWLHQVATHRAFNRLRDDKRRERREMEAGYLKINKGSDERSGDLSWKEIEPVVDQALLEIPEQLRTLILLHFIEGVTQKEIASAIGVHQSTVSRRLLEGVGLLREKLQKAGVVVSASILIACFESQPAVASTSTLATSLAKISLASFGSVKVTGISQFAWAATLAKGAIAMLFLPILAGVVLGEVFFLISFAALSCYIGLRRPEWLRIFCYTTQFPNIYEWSFFPFKRWAWVTPPNDWRVWMVASMAIGIELLTFSIVAPVSFGLQHGSLLLMSAGLFLVFTSARIWKSAHCCTRDSLEGSLAPTPLVDGVLLFTYASGLLTVFAKLCVLPFFISNLGVWDKTLWQIILCAIVWATILVFGSLLVLRRFKQWRFQPPMDHAHKQKLVKLAPPRWLLILFFLLSIALATFITYLSLLQDVLPLYVPFGSDAISAARSQMLGIHLSALDFLIVAILPLFYLQSRIPRVAWGVGVALLGLLSTFHIGFFAKSVLGTPTLSIQPIFAKAPGMDVLPGRFVLTFPKMIQSDSGILKSDYQGKMVLANVRLDSAASIVLQYGDRSVALDIPYDVTKRMAATGITVIAHVMPREFDAGAPKRLVVSMAISDINQRESRSEGVELPLPDKLTPSEWQSQFEVWGRTGEQSFTLGKSIDLCTVQEIPVSLMVKPLNGL